MKNLQEIFDFLCLLVDRSVNRHSYSELTCNKYRELAYKFKEAATASDKYLEKDFNALLVACKSTYITDGNWIAEQVTKLLKPQDKA